MNTPPDNTDRSKNDKIVRVAQMSDGSQGRPPARIDRFCFSPFPAAAQLP